MSSKVDIITGCSGQDGSLLTKYLLEQGRSVIGICRASSDLKNLNRLKILDNPRLSIIKLSNGLEYLDLFLEYNRIDNFFHFAGFSSVGKSFKFRNDAYQANLELPITIASSMLRANVEECTFWQASSAYIFNCDQPIDSDSLYRAFSPYASSKLKALKALKSVFENTSIEIVPIHWFNHSGSFSNENFIIPKIMNKVAQGVLGGKKEVIVSLYDQEVRRDWGVADNFMSRLAGSLERKSLIQEQNKNGIYASSSINASVRELLEEISRQCGLSIIVEILGNNMGERPWDPRNVSVSSKCAAEQVLSFKQESLQEVVKEWLDDFTEYMSNIHPSSFTKHFSCHPPRHTPTGI